MADKKHDPKGHGDQPRHNTVHMYHPTEGTGIFSEEDAKRLKSPWRDEPYPEESEASVDIQTLSAAKALAVIGETEDVSALETMLEGEKKGKRRTAVLKAIEAAIAAQE